MNKQKQNKDRWISEYWNGPVYRPFYFIHCSSSEKDLDVLIGLTVFFGWLIMAHRRAKRLKLRTKKPQPASEKNNSSQASPGVRFLMFIVLILIIFGFIPTIMANSEKEKEQERIAEQEHIADCYSNCPLAIDGQIKHNGDSNKIIINFHNKSSDVVTTVNFMMICYNEYGEKLNSGIECYEYNLRNIGAGDMRSGTTTLPERTSSVHIYVYSARVIRGSMYTYWGMVDCSKQTAFLAPCFIIVDDC